MARAIHLLGEGGLAACCGKSMSALGFGAILTDNVGETTCPSFATLEAVTVDEQIVKLREEVQDTPHDLFVRIERDLLLRRIAELEEEIAELRA